MSSRESAENETPASSAELSHRSEGTALPAESLRDRLEYIADMVQELKIMSTQANCPVLAGLLETARREALRQRDAGG